MCFPCNRERQRIRTGIGEGGRDAESRGIGASEAIGYGGRNDDPFVVLGGAGEGAGGKCYTHGGKERREGIIYYLLCL